MSDIGGRLKDVLKEIGATQTSFAEMVGYHQSDISKMIVGKRHLTQEVMVTLHIKYGVDLNWLISGNGKFNSTEQDIIKRELKDTNEIIGLQVQLGDLHKRIIVLEDKIASMS